MSVRIGASPAPDDLEGMVLGCHHRIRRFLGVAERLTATPRPGPDEARDAAGRVADYFEQALPLHAADEDETIAPRLRGRDPELDAILDRMHAEHGTHEPAVDALVRACREIETTGRLDPDRLRPRVRAVEEMLLPHLELEERHLLPALAGLEPETSAEMIEEIRARRALSG